MKRSFALVAVFVLVFLLAACGRDAGEPEATTFRLSGEAHYLERIVMPPGAWLEVELIDEDSEQVLASTRIDDAETPPFNFELEVDADDWRAVREPLVYFTLYLPDGSPRFAAELRPDVALREADELAFPRVRLIGVDHSEQDLDPVDEPDWLSWRCGEVPVDVRLDQEERLHLALPWRDLRLDPVVAASGVRYQGDGHEFWSRGSEQARLVLPGQDGVECERSERLSPWTDARLRGVVFRAAGQEPGWLLELSGVEAPVLDLSLDYGTRELRFEEVEVLAGNAGYVAESPGNHAEIDLIERDCQDPMSGWVFPVRVEMRLNDLVLSACGRML
jgi:putative lipoprotein